jgi:RNA-directed DNA polymerase
MALGGTCGLELTLLAALETGVKGGRWYSLMDKVARRDVLEAAFRRVQRNGGSPGVDHVRIEDFEERLEENLSRLSESLLAGTYRPQAIRRREIRKHPGSGGRRPLGFRRFATGW